MDKHKKSISNLDRPVLESYGPDVHPPVDWDADVDGAISDDVLIDIDGQGRTFTTGAYDFGKKKWRFHREYLGEVDVSKIIWMPLPLIKYEK